MAPYVALNRQLSRRRKAALLARVADLGLPVIVKPSREGSSVGMSKVTESAALEPRWKKPSAMTTMCWWRSG